MHTSWNIERLCNTSRLKALFETCLMVFHRCFVVVGWFSLMFSGCRVFRFRIILSTSRYKLYTVDDDEYGVSVAYVQEAPGRLRRKLPHTVGGCSPRPGGQHICVGDPPAVEHCSVRVCRRARRGPGEGAPGPADRYHHTQ